MEVIHKIGRRKKSVARVYLSKGKGVYSINGKSLEEYFPTALLQYKINQPFTLTETLSSYNVKVNVYGGGINGQAESIRLAISRALCEINEEYRPMLKKEGLMTRDPRMVERKKFGQKKARKKFQFSKR
jgi:small subunit ribosomal protein S9|tara:strand:+ start:6007 stop:6393 length:387 start_codon:yes stop_codon:yes gene_type:complete